ncbi:MAG: ribosome assembly cofactor RimP [Polaribacter sp.]|uniref:ribosome assembly cofactor RimP n=1 Tax=Polaribacter sp. TaxID=1920175 RepID=UPI003BAF8CF6
MEQSSKVRDLVEEALALNESLFLIDLSISANNKIQVLVDGDQGVPLSECIRISRNVEHNLDREIEDFSLEVSTPDISHPLKEKRQYRKNVNRILNIKTSEEELEGTLVEVDDEKIVLQWKTREPKPVGKGKVTVEKTATINYKDIKEAKVKIVF